MQNRHLQGLLTTVLAGLLLWSAVADARIQILANNTAPPVISIRVGDKDSIVNTVSFNVPANRVGDNTPVKSSPPRSIWIEVEIRSTAANPLTGVLTVDSLSDPLKNTTSSSTIPFSEISWESNKPARIPPGVFQETVDQYIISYQSSSNIRAKHTFSYANTLVIEAGTYTGSVKYTWAVP